jgi:predicted Zn-dependent protease
MQIHSAYRYSSNLLVLLLFASSSLAQTRRLHPDIENIGRRDLTPWMVKYFKMSERENDLGSKAAREFETTVKLLDDALVTDYVARLGRALVQHSDVQSPVEFRVVDSQTPDLTVMPAGHVFVNAGLIAASANEAEFAAVLSNAIAHIAARHVMQVLTQAQVLQLSAIPAQAIAWHWSEGESPKAVELEGLRSMCEKEADQLAIQYLWNTGYAPTAYTTVLERRLGQPVSDQERLRSAKMEQQSLPDKGPYRVSSAEFETVKSHLFKRQHMPTPAPPSTAGVSPAAIAVKYK